MKIVYRYRPWATSARSVNLGKKEQLFNEAAKDSLEEREFLLPEELAAPPAVGSLLIVGKVHKAIIFEVHRVEWHYFEKYADVLLDIKLVSLELNVNEFLTALQNRFFTREEIEFWATTAGIVNLPTKSQPVQTQLEPQPQS